MFLIRKIGKVVRGSASLPQIVAASVLGAMLGFVPGFFLPGDLGGGFMQAPGLILALFALVLVIDANLAVFGLVTLGAKLLSFVLLPVSFAIGRYLIDGPLEGLIRTLVNAPVTATFGLERYATTGGVTLGLVVGLVAGVVLWLALHALRVKMATIEEGSERYQKYATKRSVKLLLWVFFGGGKGKKSWREIAESDRKGRYVRIAGLVVVLVLGVGLWFVQDSFGSAWLRETATSGLTRWNGATVDLGGATLDLAEGHVAFDALAMTDVDRLDHDMFRARTMDLDVATSEMLAGRFVVERITSGDPKSGVVRNQPGKRIQPVEPPAPPPTGPGKSIDDYLKDAEVWKQRLDTAVEWIRKFSGDGEVPTAETPAERDERIAHDKDVLGLVNVIAEHLIADKARVVVKELSFEGLTFGAGDGTAFDLKGQNLSSSPALGAEPALLSLTSKTGDLAIGLRYDPKDPKGTGIDFGWKGLSVDALAGSLKDSPIRGGTLDLKLAGRLDLAAAGGPSLDLPLTVVLRGTTLSIGGKEAKLDQLSLPIGLSGSLSDPRISIDPSAVSDALVAAGRQELANEVRARADALLGGKVPGVGEALGGLVDGTKTPEQLAAEAKAKAEAEAARLAEEAKKKAEEEARKKAEEELKKKLPGGIGDIFKKKD